MPTTCAEDRVASTRRGPGLTDANDIANSQAFRATARALAAERDDDDDLISLRDLASQLPSRRGGRPCHVSCVYRWTAKGCRGVRLRYLQAGASRVSTRRWLREFFETLTLANPGETPSPARTPKARSKAADKAGRELDRIGIR